ncbi:hypothetical protein ColKHC_03807 [Colletotrichum higginsianum]|nr:hypothetical protein ColKHC_03807 [Colletotrichum higginsianum]
MPLCFTPPNGTRTSESLLLFTYTMPASNSLATRCAIARSLVKTAAPSPRVVGHRQRLLLGPEPHCGGGEFRDKRLVHSLVYEDARGGRADLPPRLLMMLSQEQRTARSRSALSKTIRGDLPAISSGDNFQGAGGEPHDLLTRGRAASEGHLVDARVSGEGGACLATVFVDDGDDAWRETGLLDQPHDGLVVVKVCRLELGTKSLSMKRPRGWAHVLPFGAARSAAGQRGEGAIGGNDKGSRRHSAGWSGHPGRMQQGGKGERTWFTSENERGEGRGERGAGLELDAGAGAGAGYIVDRDSGS